MKTRECAMGRALILSALAIVSVSTRGRVSSTGDDLSGAFRAVVFPDLGAGIDNFHRFQSPRVGVAIIDIAKLT
jgi:hypothetical protein